MMKCKIFLNGGYIFIVCLLIFKISSAFEKVLSVQELCSRIGTTYNVSPQEKFVLKLSSAKSGNINKWYHKSKRRCVVDFQTNNAASHFLLSIKDMNITSCSEECKCNYFEVIDGSFIKKFCGENTPELYFESKNSFLSLVFYPGLLMQFDVTLIFFTERNFYVVHGKPSESVEKPGHFIETPYFPSPYPHSYHAEYILQSDDPAAKVLLMFFDYQISKGSFIEVIGNNGTVPTRFYGDVFRPPTILSQGRKLSLKFEAEYNPGNPGFRALCKFVKNDSQLTHFRNCGGSKDWRGGSITLSGYQNEGLYDCVWHIIPPVFSTSNNFLSVMIRSLKNTGHNTTLEFREGLYSKSRLVQSFVCDASDCNIQTSEEVTVLASRGLYIRYSGYLKLSSLITLAYSTYHVGNCNEEEIVCHNGRCLQLQLKCDGIEHCPNGSDEKSCLVTEEVGISKITIPPDMKYEGIHQSNIKSAYILLLIFGGFGLIVVILVIAVFIFRWHKILPPVSESSHPTNEIPVVQPRLNSQARLLHDCLPSYDDFILSSDRYPQLLYTQTTKPWDDNCHSKEHTTSFCNKKNHFNSFNESITDSTSDMFSEELSTLEQACSCSFQGNRVPQSTNKLLQCNLLKKSGSLDSKLNEISKNNACHLSLSVTHSDCLVNMHHNVQTCTLPSNFKLNCGKTEITYEVSEPSAALITEFLKSDCTKNRYFSWSFFSPSVKAEVLAILKARCYSDPCKHINIECSMERESP